VTYHRSLAVLARTRSRARAVVRLVAAIVALAWGGRTARAEPVRILVAAGSSAGFAAERTLAHPRDDAQGVRDVLTSLGGVRAEHAIVVPDATRGALVDALERARQIAARHAPGEVTLLVYFSGHGDRDALHLSGESVTSAELAARVGAIPAALRVVVVDACRIDVDRAKGMTVQPGFAVSLTAPTAATGTAWLYAAGDGEAAQESDEIGGAIFTHYWLAGLRGAADVNGDRRVTLDESFAYAYAQTLLRSARAGGVLQRPQARLDLTEASPVVLTELAGPRAQLELPPGGDALYLVYGVGSQSVVGEVYAAPDRVVRLVLPPGRYIVQKRAGARGAAVEVVLRAGATHAVSPDELRPFPREALAQKGDLLVRPWSIELAGAAGAGLGEGPGGEVALRVAYRSDWGLALGPLAGASARTTAFNDVRERFAGGELSIDRFVALAGPLALRAGADVRGEWIAQRVTRRDAAQVASVGLPAVADFGGAAWGGGAHLGLRYAVTPSLYLDAGGRVLALGAKTDAGAELRVVARGFLTIGASF